MILATAARLHRLGRHKECLKAIEALETSLDKLSSKARRQLLFLKADVFHDLGRFREAVACLQEILVEEPSDVAYANQGLAHWELGEYQMALKCYLESIRLNPANEVAQRGAGEMHVKLGSPQAALPFLRRALKLNPEYQEAYTSSGVALYQLGLWSQAYKMLEKALVLDPKDSQAKKGIALIEKHFDL